MAAGGARPPRAAGPGGHVPARTGAQARPASLTCVIGIDLGTSALKAVLLDEAEGVRASAEIPLATQNPGPLASEQDPRAWIAAMEGALAILAAEAPDAMGGVRSIGLAGQMHAAVLLDAADRPIRPAMLWNDGRAETEALALRNGNPELASILGVPAMAGLTAPKLAWLGRHEPQTLAAARVLLSAKDVLRLHLCGERVTDVSDAAGTWLLDQRRRAWSTDAAAAVGIAPALLPPLVESDTACGVVRDDVAARFGLPGGVVVAGGGGDTPCGGLGIGAVETGDAFVSLGTSAQIFVADDAYRPALGTTIHTFCHALPKRWYAMAALLNGASVLGMVARLTRHADPAPLLASLEQDFRGPGRLLMLPYLAGERTPHDDARARGAVIGLSGDTTPADLALAAMEAVAFSLADALDTLAAAGTRPACASFIGGGSRSRLWGRIIASVLGIELRLHGGGARGAAFGAARLARAAAGLEPAWSAPAITATLAPEAELAQAYAGRLPAFRALYQALRPEFRR